jgi:hypothetical protein
VYHLQDHGVAARLDLKHKKIFWQEDRSRPAVVMAYLPAGKSLSKVISLETDYWSLKELFETKGSVESLLLVDQHVYLIEKTRSVDLKV